MPKFRHSERRVTQREIADIVGVSHVVVSHALHQPHRARVSPQTRQEILRVARQLGYESRPIATHTIGFVVWEGLYATLENVTTQVAIASRILRQRGYHLSLLLLSPEDLEQNLPLFDAKAVDGVIFTEWMEGRAPQLLAEGIPWVLMSNEEPAESVDLVAVDAVETASLMIHHLCDHGHRQIAFASGRGGIVLHRELLKGMQAALRERGVTAPLREVADPVETLLANMESSNPATAIIFLSPGGAVMALNRLQAAGYRVPEDVSLLSYTDHYRLETLQPTITSTTALGEAVIAQAVDRLIQKIKEPRTPPRRTFVPAEIVERASVAPPSR